MTLFGFTEAETIPYMGLLILTTFFLTLNYRKGFQQTWSPLTIIFLVYGYYCLLGPYQSIASGKTYDRLINMRPFYELSFWAAFISLIAILAGFYANQKQGRPIRMYYDDSLLSEFGKKICILGLILFSISTGGNIFKLLNPVNTEAVDTVGGSFANYFGLCINFLIPGVTLLFAYYLKTKKGLWWFVIIFLTACSLYTSLGFRWRLVLLVLSMAITYYFLMQKRPNLILASFGIFAFISIMGLIDLTRNYGRGLDLSQLDKKREGSFYENGLNEARIFQASGAIISMVPERHPYAGFTPIISTILFPIPSSIYRDKNSADYLFNALNAIYGKVNSKGAAFMSYAEHYLAFGWIGIIIGGFLLGWFYKKLWCWYLANSQNTLVIVTYATTVSFLYVILSRGYLPQVTMFFFFSIFPIYVVLRIIRKRQHRAKPIRIVSSAN